MNCDIKLKIFFTTTVELIVGYGRTQGGGGLDKTLEKKFFMENLFVESNFSLELITSTKP